jgi:glycine dehydrogenase
MVLTNRPMKPVRTETQEAKVRSIMTAPNTKPNPSVIPEGFASRHIGPGDADIETMLEMIGASSLDALIEECMPAGIRYMGRLNLPPAHSEVAALRRMAELASHNRVVTSLIGQGYHGTILPGVIQRNILENPAWYTAYTPYQPEISQGRLEALLNFQTMICDLTGLDVANASLLDEATAVAEAMALCARNSTKPERFFVDNHTHPQTIAVLKTRAAPLGWEITVGDPHRDLDPQRCFGAVLQYPGTFGEINDPRPVIARLHAAGAFAVLAADPLALMVLQSPGELGADIAVGTTQRFGVPPGFGGPHAAYIAVKDALKRGMPGRLVGVSVDASGDTAYRLALQTREQHIRREKATSNICTAQVLLAVVASMYAVYHGPTGLKRIATETHTKTSVLAAGLAKLGFEFRNSHYFDTLTVEVGSAFREIVDRGLARDLNFRLVDATALGVTLDETTTRDVIVAVWNAFGGTLDYDAVAASAQPGLPAALARATPCLNHPVFNSYHSETEMLRYMRKLADRDLALDRSMIPLGSCTMKLNATSEMLPVTWPSIANIHPFAPREQVAGYLEMLAEMEGQLCEITGYDAVSLQPNSGAQGEYAGLLAIRDYHLSRGDGHRNVCLIPTSAHGTNPASAQMAGMEVVAVGCDSNGNVDAADLSAKAKLHAPRLAAMMLTYPSTHGVFESEVRQICSIVHDAGGQIYLDGANMNAQVGLARPGDYGADVSHLNLHKTFCIPHGGGGPGMGPIGVKAHLKAFLPGHPALGGEGRTTGPVSAAPYGSASVLPISYLYILMMGADGLKRATEVAILNANYIAHRLAPHFPILYRNVHHRVAHECIVDPRTLKNSAGVTVDDIAKRLIDYGFHAPTMSFPVAGTLMIEPTESESKRELDRFCDAMIAIRREIRDIEEGRFLAAASPLRHAPHTVLDVCRGDWNRPYTREEGCFPAGVSRMDKYWAPVGRVDNAHGDRNFICTCLPVEADTAAA